MGKRHQEIHPLSFRHGHLLVLQRQVFPRCLHIIYIIYIITDLELRWKTSSIWCLSSSLKVEAMIGVHGLTTVAEDSTGWLQTYFFIVCLLPPVLNADFASMHHVASPSYPWLHCTRWLIGVPSKGCFFSPKRARYYVFHLFPMKSSSCIHIISIYIYIHYKSHSMLFKNVHFEWQ